MTRTFKCKFYRNTLTYQDNSVNIYDVNKLVRPYNLDNMVQEFLPEYRKSLTMGESALLYY